MNFEFDKELQAQNAIEIDNIGEFGLEASNEEGFYYYLAVNTIMGQTVIASCGPIIPDIEMLPNGFNCSLTKLPYKEDRINKLISLWLNDKQRKIKDVNILEYKEAALEFRHLGEYLVTLSEDTI